MNKLPKFSSNKKYWMLLNKLAFGDEVVCPICKQAMQLNYSNRYCWCPACRKKYRPTAHKGSWLYGMKLQPKQFFVLLWCWQNRKSPDTTRLLALVSYRTVQRWYECFRSQLPGTVIELSELVQVDESYFGKQKSCQEQMIVVGAIEPDTRKTAFRITNSRSQAALEEFVEDHITKGSLVVTDKWYAYEELTLLGYSHESWNHSQGQFAGTNHIENLWGVIKRYLRKLYGCVPTKNLQTILNEWTARLNSPKLFSTPENYLQECLFHVS